MKKCGIFITFEGPEGAGKTTQITLLAKLIAQTAPDRVVVTREPGGTALAEELRRIIKHYSGPDAVADTTEVLLIEAGRAQHVARLIRPALEAGKIVLCDRFTDSTLAYQGGGRSGDLAQLQMLNAYAAAGVTPDLTFLLDLPCRVGMERACLRAGANATPDRLEALDLSFHERVRSMFLSLAAAEPQRFRVINAENSAEEIFAQVLQEYHALLSRI